jgi:hypothetical protein
MAAAGRIGDAPLQLDTAVMAVTSWSVAIKLSTEHAGGVWWVVWRPFPAKVDP